ncbi:MAG: TonB family protein [Acidobacteriota bacterium]
MESVNPATKWFFILAVFSLVFSTIARAQQDPAQAPKIVGSGGIVNPMPIKRVEPAYPPLAKAARVSGAVVVEVTIDEAGKVIAARALSGHPMLKDAAVAAAQQWQFKPTVISGEISKVIGTITFKFNLPGAAADLAKARQTVLENPDSGEAYSDLGKAYEANALPDEAIEAYKKVIELDPANEAAYLKLASLFAGLKLDDQELTTYQKAFEMLPNSTEIAHKLAKTLMDQKKYDAATEAYKKFLEMDTNHFVGLVEIGECYFHLERYEECIANLSVALKDGNDFRANLLLGQAYMKVGKLEEAEPHLLEAVKLNAVLPDASESLGDLYYQQGKMELANRSWHQALMRSSGESQKKRLKEKLGMK